MEKRTEFDRSSPIRRLPEQRFVSLGEKTVSFAYFDEYRLETVLLPPFLSKIKTPYGRRWVLKCSHQSRSSDSGVKQELILLTKANNAKEALVEAAEFLKWESAKFENENRTRGYIMGVRKTL